MLREHERWLSRCELAIRQHPNDAPHSSLNDLIPGLERLIADRRATYTFDSDRVLIAATGICVSSDHVSILLQVSDSRAADPAFVHMESLEQRQVPKEDGEGGGASAQFMLSKNQSLPGAHNYRGLLEVVPGVNRSRIERLLTSCFEDIASEEGFSFIRPATRRSVTHRPIANLRGLPSQSLAAALVDGELRELRLIETEAVSRGLDEASWIKDSEVRHRFLFKSDVPPDIARRLVASAVDRGRQMGAQLLGVTVRQGQKTISLEVELAEGSPMEALLVKHERVDLRQAHHQCRSSISGEIDDAMRTLIE